MNKKVINGGIILARPIEPTPTLYGKDADRFARMMFEPPTEKEKRLKNYEKAIERKDYRTANKITIPLFRDLYQFKISHLQKGHDS